MLILVTVLYSTQEQKIKMIHWGSYLWAIYPKLNNDMRNTAKSRVGEPILF